MRTSLKSALSLTVISLFCSSVQAASIKYIFTFNPTSVSALTSYYLSSPSLLSGSNHFNSSEVKLTSPPGPGAVIPPNFPIVAVDETGSVGIVFGSGSKSWEFTGLTSPLKALGTYAFLSGSEVSSGMTTDFVTGSVAIGEVPQTATPEPAALLLLSGGLLLLGLGARWKNLRA